MVTRRREDLLPSLGVAIAGAAWGLFWLPMRGFNEAGLQPAWTAIAIYVTAIVIFLPAVVIRWQRFVEGGFSMLITGMLTGSAFSLYATALVLTEVVRALLLFYLTPIWGTLLGCLLLGEKITKWRGVALAMGVAGLLVILGYEHGFPWPQNIGDWLALMSGVTWAYGSVRIYGTQGTGFVESTFAYFVGAVVAAVVLLPIESVGSVPEAATLKVVMPWLLLMTAVLVVPSMLIVFWGTARLSPGRVGLLLMADAVVGIASAALLTEEPFGARELIGTILIVGAALIEVLQQRSTAVIGVDSPAEP